MVMERRQAELVLSEAEHPQLSSIARSRTIGAALAARARIVLAASASQANAEIVQRLQVSGATVGKRRRRFVERRIIGLYDEFGPGKPCTIVDELLAETLPHGETIRASPGEGVMTARRPQHRTTHRPLAQPSDRPRPPPQPATSAWSVATTPPAEWSGRRLCNSAAECCRSGRFSVRRSARPADGYPGSGRVLQWVERADHREIMLGVRDVTHVLDQGVQTDHSHGFQQGLVRETRSASLGEGRGLDLAPMAHHFRGEVEQCLRGGVRGTAGHRVEHLGFGGALPDTDLHVNVDAIVAAVERGHQHGNLLDLLATELNPVVDMLVQSQETLEHIGGVAGPDGQVKLLHFWPVKLLQAGRADYEASAVRAMRAAASLRR